VTRKRILTAAEVLSKLLPVVAPGKAATAGVVDALDAIVRHADNDLSVVVDNSPRLRRRIKELKRQLHETPDTAGAEKLRTKLDILHELLVEDAEVPDE